MHDDSVQSQLSNSEENAETCKASGTQGRTRTGTPVKAGDFESPASTIPPLGHCALFSDALRQGPDLTITFFKEIHAKCLLTLLYSRVHT